MYMLGISCFFHDAAAALLKDRVLVAAAEEERSTRKKHAFEFPIPAIRHVLEAEGITASDLGKGVVRDGTPRYYDLTRRFGEATGVPLVLNTSFNLRGEPIVNTPREAYSTFMRSGMDTLVLGNCIIRKDGKTHG